MQRKGRTANPVNSSVVTQEAMLIRECLTANLPERASDLFGDSDMKRH